MHLRILIAIFVFVLCCSVQASDFLGMWNDGLTDNQPIIDYYNAKGDALMGNPFDGGNGICVYKKWDTGPVQDFNGGLFGRMLVCDSANIEKAYSIRGNFYSAISTHQSILEFPLSDQFFTGIGEKQYFEGGYLTWSEASGIVMTEYSNKIISDDSGSGFSKIGLWIYQAAGSAYEGGYRKHSFSPASLDTAEWNIAIAQPGFYDVYVRYPLVVDAATSAKYFIYHTSDTADVVINQRSDTKARCERWNRLGCFQFSTSARIKILGKSPVGEVLADAVRIIGPVTGPDTTPPTTPIVTDDGTHTSNTTQLHSSWESQDMETGIDRFEYAIGTTPTDPGNNYTIPWTSTGTQNSVIAPVNLSQGQTYYFYVRAIGPNGTSNTGISDGITVGAVSASCPTVKDDGSYTGDQNLLHCSWSSSDQDISHYEYSVGTSPFTSNIITPTNAGNAAQAWVTGLNLTADQTYYFTVRSYNSSGAPSDPGCSDGIIYKPATPASTIADALELPNTTRVILKNKTISALFANRFYIKDTNALRGIAIDSANGLPQNSLCDITGTLDTIDGERVITPGCITPGQP